MYFCVIVVQKLHIFKAYNLMNFDVCINLSWNFTTIRIMNIFHYLQIFPHAPFKSLLPIPPHMFPYSNPWVTTDLFSVFSRILYKLNHALCTLSCLASFIHQNYFYIAPCWNVHQQFTYFHHWKYSSLSENNLFIHSPVDGHLGCFQFGAVKNKAAMNIHK